MGKSLGWLFISSFWIYLDLLTAFNTREINDLVLTKKYQEKFQVIVDHICSLIEEETNYLDLVSQIVSLGQTYAKEMGFQDPNSFITERRNESIKNRVKEVLDSFFQEKLDLLLKHSQPQSEINGLKFADGKFFKITSKNTLFPELSLAYIVHVPQQIPLTEGHVLSYFGEGFENTTIFLSSSKDLNRMQNYLFCKWEELIEQPFNESFIKELAIFHWYFIQVHPLFQGSDFVAKTLIDSLLKSKGISLKIDPSRQMEFEVFFEPLIDEFIRKYNNFLAEA